MHITQHAQARLKERAADADLILLWQVSRPARPDELSAFHTDARPHCEYRIAVWRGRVYLLLRGTQTGNFITLWNKQSK